jgi:hypothetical protein
LKAINKQKSQEVKLLAEEDKNTRKCKKESKKQICTRYAFHRSHDDSHHATMGTTIAPKEPDRIFSIFEANRLHHGHDGSEAH